MTKAELEKKSLSELHSLAAEAGVERYRMLPRAELIAKLAGGDSGSGGGERSSRPSGEQRERPARRRRRSGGKAEPRGEGRPRERARKQEPKEPKQREQRKPAEPEPAPAEPAPAPTPAGEAAPKPRRRRRRRFGRRGKQGLTLQGLLLPPAGRQAVLCAETREGCTALLRGIAADLGDGEKGPDPVALLIDPSPEELADWRREAPKAEIVAAGQARHASDALAQAKSRAAGGEEVILLIDSLNRLAEAFDDTDVAKEFFDAAGGNLTVVAALLRS